MIKKNLDMQKWNFRLSGKVDFIVIYLINSKPWNLSFSVRIHNIFFEFDVNENFEVVDFLGGARDRIVQLLRTHGLSGFPFDGKVFLSEFNPAIPAVASANNVPQRSEIVWGRRDVAEPDRIYFHGWRKNPDGHQVRNARKAKLLLGEKAEAYSKKTNQSSTWTDDPTLEVPPF